MIPAAWKQFPQIAEVSNVWRCCAHSLQDLQPTNDIAWTMAATRRERETPRGKQREDAVLEMW
jgi:hypothetical protein